jgi:T5SS/PEP-CTERM-associated repeat protein
MRFAPLYAPAHFAILGLAISLGPAHCGSAQTTFWVATGVGNWYVAANWGSGLPDATTDAQINNGGTAQLFDPLARADDLTLGFLAANSGALDINGGSLTVDVFDAGARGTGSLHVLNQGRLTSTGAFVGGDAGSHGTVTVEGAMSKWVAGNVLNVGYSGEGALSILGGGAVSSSFTSVGNDPGASGTLLIDGVGSSHSVTGDLTVGPQGVGIVTVRNGAHAANSNGNLGAEVEGSGVVNVEGAGTTWSNGVVAVGVRGTGALNVIGGAIVSGTNGRIAREPDSHGMAIVDGPGSQWNSTGVFTIANNSVGKLIVRNGGSVSANLGLTIQTGGVLEGDGTVIANVTNNHIVTPGATLPGTLHISGNYSQGTAASLLIELASAASIDKLAVTGTATLSGALSVQLAGGYVPLAGTAFDLLDWGSRSGTFTSVSLPVLPSPLAWNTSLLYASGVVSVSSPFLAADFNENHFVDAADLVKWKTGFGTPAGASHLQGDADFEGDVDGFDFLLWQRQLGLSAPPISSNEPLPEPATMLLGAVAAAGVCGNAGRSRQLTTTP